MCDILRRRKKTEIKLWWSHKNKRYEKKKINLKKVPEKYRCPDYGKILVKTKDRKGYQVKITRNKKVKIDENSPYYHEVYKRLNLDYMRVPDGFYLGVANKEDYFGSRNIELGMYGGVCQECWLDGLGSYGKFGGFLGHMLELEEKKQNRNNKR